MSKVETQYLGVRGAASCRLACSSADDLDASSCQADPLTFRRQIWANRRPIEDTVNELWIDTVEGPRHVVYLSDTC